MEQTKSNISPANGRSLDLEDLFDSSQMMSSRRRVVALGGSALLSAGIGHWASVGPALAQQVLTGAGDQPEWRFCDRCFSMFYNRPNPNNYPGRCAAGGSHQAQGFLFTLHYDSDKRQPVAGRDSQFDWRFCGKCFAMFWDAGQHDHEHGRCPAGGGHLAYGFIFGLPHDNAANPGQPDWRFCGKCNGLFFDDPRNSNKGVCAAGGSHVRASNSFNFQLPFHVDPVKVSLPPLGQKVVAYAASHVGQCVADTNGTIRPGVCGPPPGIGPGECTHLAHSALVASGARPPNYSNPPHYTWGTRVQAPYQPGDIIEMVNTRFDGPNGAFSETSTQHTAIIESAQGTLLHLLQQHAPERMVTRGALDLGWRLSKAVLAGPSADYAIFRPIPA
jgi:hypothetical protein